MSPKMGRPKTKDFSPEKFQKLSREERQLRGRISTLKRMIKKREIEIQELMKPIQKKRNEITEIQDELDGITKKFQNSDFKFPSFRIEGYISKGKSYYRGVWYVNSKKKQLYLGSEEKVWETVGITDTTLDKDEKILNFYLKELQMKFWNEEYREFQLNKDVNYRDKNPDTDI